MISHKVVDGFIKRGKNLNLCTLTQSETACIQQTLIILHLLLTEGSFWGTQHAQITITEIVGEKTEVKRRCLNG